MLGWVPSACHSAALHHRGGPAAPLQPKGKNAPGPQAADRPSGSGVLFFSIKPNTGN